MKSSETEATDSPITVGEVRAMWEKMQEWRDRRPTVFFHPDDLAAADPALLAWIETFAWINTSQYVEQGKGYVISGDVYSPVEKWSI